MITLPPVQVLTITVPRVRRILDFLLPGLSRRNRSGHSLADRNLAMTAFTYGPTAPSSFGEHGRESVWDNVSELSSPQDPRPILRQYLVIDISSSNAYL